MKLGEQQTFYYTGTFQEITLLPAYYLFECFGASGGRGHGYTYAVSNGGYISGVLFLKQKQTFYIVVGQEGNHGDSRRVSYNGGGIGGWDNLGRTENGGSGGGASDIRILKADNPLDKNSLQSRILVAGGAGGNGGWSNCKGHPGGNLNQSTYILGEGAPGVIANSGGGGGGAGYYGGNTDGAHWDNYWVGKGAYGGTSFADEIFEDVVEKPGYNQGNGKVQITFIKHAFYYLLTKGGNVLDI